MHPNYSSEAGAVSTLTSPKEETGRKRGVAVSKHVPNPKGQIS